MKVISVLLDENFRVYGVLALDYECIWVKSWKLKLVGLDEVWVNRKFKDLDYICRQMNKFNGTMTLRWNVWLRNQVTVGWLIWCRW